MRDPALRHPQGNSSHGSLERHGCSHSGASSHGHHTEPRRKLGLVSVKLMRVARWIGCPSRRPITKRSAPATSLPRRCGACPARRALSTPKIASGFARPSRPGPAVQAVGICGIMTCRERDGPGAFFGEAAPDCFLGGPARRYVRVPAVQASQRRHQTGAYRVIPGTRSKSVSCWPG